MPQTLCKVEADNHRHGRLLAGMQRLRGKTYLADGAIRPEELTPDGRHQTVGDERAWHVLSVDANDRVSTCLRYLDERNSSGFGDLWVSHAAMARCPQMGWKLRKAVELRMERARAGRIGFGSVGGWAAAQEERRTMAPVAIILATYGLLELLGGCVGVATATFRHHSATMLRKIGLNPLTLSGAELPPYFDPQYGCEMEILEFDSGRPNAKYREAVQQFTASLSIAPVICRDAIVPALGGHSTVEYRSPAMAAVA